MRRGGIGSVVRSLLWLPGLAAAELAAIAVIAPDRAAIAVRQLRGLSAAEIGVWPISSLKLLGFPGGPAPWSSAPLVDVAAALAMTAAVVAVLAALWRRRLDGAPAAALLVVFLGAYALYGGALLVRGVSYQTFKLATFFVPLLTAALPAALLGLAAGPGRRLLRAGIIAACAVVVVVDLVAGLRRHFMVLPRDLEPLAAIDALSGIDTVLVQGLSFAETMLVRQYVTRHRLQFGQASYYAWRPIAPAEVSPARPVLFAPGTCFAGAPGVVMLGRFALARALPPVAPAPPAAMAPVAGPAAARDDPCRWLRRGADR
jgi:hypothetical protein